jgi:hypothetical protein
MTDPFRQAEQQCAAAEREGQSICGESLFAR